MPWCVFSEFGTDQFTHIPKDPSLALEQPGDCPSASDTTLSCRICVNNCRNP